MRKVLLFLAIVAAFYCGSKYFGRRSPNPKVVAEGVIKQKSSELGQDSFYVEVNRKMYPVVRVFSSQGSWVYPKKDSVVTAFVTEKNPQLRFMEGKVGKTEIDAAFQCQIPRVFGIFALLALVVICYWNPDEKDIELPNDEKS